MPREENGSEKSMRDLAYEGLSEIAEKLAAEEAPKKEPDQAAEPEAPEPEKAEEPEKPEGTPKEGEEPKKEEGETPSEPEPQEPFIIPEDAEFEFKEDGKPVKVKGIALLNAYRQRADIERRAQEVKTEREQLASDREQQVKEITENIQTETYRRLVEAGAIVEGADGSPQWNPALSRKARDEARETAKEGAEVAVAGELKIPRLNLEEMDEEEAAFLPKKVVDTLNAYAEALERERTENAAFRENLRNQQEQQHRKEEEARVETFRREVEGAVGKSPVFGASEERRQAAFNLVVERYRSGYQGTVEECVSNLDRVFGPSPEEPEPKEEPTAGGGGGQERLPPRKTAPPAVGSPGRKPEPIPSGKKKRGGKLGTRGATLEIEEELRRKLGKFS